MSRMRALWPALARRARARSAWLARRAGFDGNPLRRGSDRAEAWVRAVLVAAFLIGAPILTAGVGNWVAAGSEAAARAHDTAVHQVDATLRRDTAEGAQHPVRGALIWVPARWVAPDGSTRTGQIQAPPGTQAGATVPIWVDGSGRLSDPPLTHAQVLGRVVGAIALAVVSMAILLALLLGILHRLLERRRLRAWEAAWSAVEPHWTRRLH